MGWSGPFFKIDVHSELDCMKHWSNSLDRQIYSITFRFVYVAILVIYFCLP